MPYRGGASPPNRWGIFNLMQNMGKRLTTEEYCELIKDKPLTMLKYAGTVSKSKSTFKCNVCNHIWNTKWYNIYKDKSGCPKCSKHIQLTVQDCIRRLEGRGITLINYAGTVSNKTSVFKCVKCQYKWSTAFNSINAGRGCVKCAGLKTPTLTECKDKLNVESRRLHIISFSKNSSDPNSLFQCCLCSYTWKTSWESVYNKKSNCPACAKLGFNPSKPAWVYILLLDTPQGYCYGFGITNNLDKRLKEHRLSLGPMLDQEYEPLYFDSGVDAQNLESTWKQSSYITNAGVTGFKTECVLVNKETTKMIFG